MEIKKENGKVITTMSFAEAFLDEDIIQVMTQEQQDEASKEIIKRLSELVSYPKTE